MEHRTDFRNVAREYVEQMLTTYAVPLTRLQVLQVEADLEAALSRAYNAGRDAATPHSSGTIRIPRVEVACADLDRFVDGVGHAFTDDPTKPNRSR